MPPRRGRNVRLSESAAVRTSLKFVPANSVESSDLLVILVVVEIDVVCHEHDRFEGLGEG